MSISLATWRNPLQWNRFRNIKCEDVDYGYDIIVVTQVLTLKEFPPDQLMRLELIEKLYQQGLNSVQISHFMKESYICSPTGLQYDPKLVWVSHDKFLKRKKRVEETTISVDQDYFFVKKGVKFSTM